MKTFAQQASESIFTIMENGDLCVEHAVLNWRNFEGRATRFNPQGGKRVFNLILTEEVKDILIRNGWNVKTREPRDADDDEMIFTEVVVNLESKYPPKCYLVGNTPDASGNFKLTELDGNTIKILDTCELKNVDLVVHPYEHNRETSNGSKVKGYLKEIYAMIAPSSSFSGKYANCNIGDTCEVPADDDLPF